MCVYCITRAYVVDEVVFHTVLYPPPSFFFFFYYYYYIIILIILYQFIILINIYYYYFYLLLLYYYLLLMIIIFFFFFSSMIKKMTIGFFYHCGCLLHGNWMPPIVGWGKEDWSRLSALQIDQWWALSPNTHRKRGAKIRVPRRAVGNGGVVGTQVSSR